MSQACKIHQISPLELTMRQVQDNMEEFTCEFDFHDLGSEFEILSIESPDHQIKQQHLTLLKNI